LNDILASDFISAFFDDLYAQGYFYFIFDSFDEIPMLLDETETSWLVNRISALLYKVCSHNNNTKIILSSRYYHQPTEQFDSHAKMQIKPFSKASIQKYFSNFKNTNQLSIKLFSEHKEMMEIAQNPFYANLISLYYENTQTLPSKEVDLYENFIELRLKLCDKEFNNISSNGLSFRKVIEYTQQIATAIFNNANLGIEIPYESVINDIQIPKIVIDILLKSKLIRKGGGSKQAISFAHRRFNEYFVACSLMNKDISTYISSIPADSKWRDALVLYAQLCSSEKATELIQFCCSFFKKVNTFYDNKDINSIEENNGNDESVISTNDRYVKTSRNKISFFRFVRFLLFRTLSLYFDHFGTNIEKEKMIRIKANSNLYKAIHSLNFLVSAFSSQPQYIIPYQFEVFNFVDILLHGGGYFYPKIALQTVPILSERNIESVLNDVLASDIRLISYEAIQNCSYLKSISNLTLLKIIRYYATMSLYEFVKDFRQHMFFMSLSKEFSQVRKFLLVRIINFIISVLFSFLIIVVMYLVLFLVTNGTIIPAYLIDFLKLGYLMVTAWFVQYLLNWFAGINSSLELNGQIIYTIVIDFVICIRAIGIHNLYYNLILILLLLNSINVYYLLYIFQNRKSLFNNISTKIKRLIYLIPFIILITLVVFIPIFAILYAVKLTNRLLVLNIPYMTFLSALSWITILLYIIVKIDIKNLIIDRKKFKQLDFFDQITRRDISYILRNLCTKTYKYKFLNTLKDKDIKIIGEWENNIFPKFYDYKLDVILAQLEERWLNL
jgi:hypothetical protein